MRHAPTIALTAESFTTLEHEEHRLMVVEDYSSTLALKLEFKVPQVRKS
ncbi:hypothetical protein BX589_13414 [Paraburkholderia fungorum]|nr:hypothetical protein BX589_13414 [Paraburkholderia fungorum]